MRLPRLPFARRGRAPATPLPGLPEVEGTLYVVGDLHGCSALLDRMLGRIEADAWDRDGPSTLVFVGDYVDRGEDSKGVLERLAALPAQEGARRHVFVRGNHEEALLRFLSDPLGGRDWLEWGGVQTLASFGVDPVLSSAPDGALRGVSAALRRAMGPLVRWLEEVPVLMHREGNVVACHAGMVPDLPPEGQPRQALLWGSRRFMERGGPPGLWVVHGHTIVDEAQVIGNRIAVDTGAYDTGTLSAAAIGRDGMTFLTVS